MKITIVTFFFLFLQGVASRTQCCTLNCNVLEREILAYVRYSKVRQLTYAIITTIQENLRKVFVMIKLSAIGDGAKLWPPLRVKEIPMLHHNTIDIAKVESILFERRQTGLETLNIALNISFLHCSSSMTVCSSRPMTDVHRKLGCCKFTKAGG